MNNYKNKYLKYKIKYLRQKYNYNILLGGEHIFDDGKIRHKIDKALNSFRWNTNTILIDCIRDIKTQEKTNKIIKYIFDNNYIELNNLKQLNWALTYAVKLGLPYVTNSLLSLGADPNFIDQYSMSLIEYAIDEKYKLTLSYLTRKKTLFIDDILKEKYDRLIKNDNLDDHIEQTNEVDQSIFANETNIKIYNGIKKILLDKQINIDPNSVEITIE